MNIWNSIIIQFIPSVIIIIIRTNYTRILFFDQKFVPIISTTPPQQILKFQ